MGLTSLQMKMELRTPPCRQAEAASDCSPTSETRTAMRRRKRTRMKRPCDSQNLRPATTSPPRFDQCPLAADTGTAAVCTRRGRGGLSSSAFWVQKYREEKQHHFRAWESHIWIHFCLFCVLYVSIITPPPHAVGTIQKRLYNKTVYATSPT